MDALGITMRFSRDELLEAFSTTTLAGYQIVDELACVGFLGDRLTQLNGLLHLIRDLR